MVEGKTKTTKKKFNKDNSINYFLILVVQMESNYLLYESMKHIEFPL